LNLVTSALQSGRTATRALPWPWVLPVLLAAWWTLVLGSGSSTWCFLDFVNLAFHEAGHLLFRPFGMTIHYLGGTLGQLLVPALLVGYFLVKEEKPFAAALCLWWFGQNFINISIYMADARDLALPLVGGGDHDWNELFFRFGLLAEGSMRTVAKTTHLIGVAFMLAGLAWSGQFLLPDHTRARIYLQLTARWPWMERLLAA